MIKRPPEMGELFVESGSYCTQRPFAYVDPGGYQEPDPAELLAAVF